VTVTRAADSAASSGACYPAGVSHVPLVSNARLTAPSHYQDVRHVVLDTSAGAGLAYEPGDVCVVYPSNPPDAVEAMCARLGLAPDDRISVEQLDPGARAG